jgi:hypothetical protein
MPEPYDARVSRTVLRGGGAGNSAPLPDHLTRPRLLFLTAFRVSVQPVANSAGPVSLIVRVRHEVADVAVLRLEDKADGTCCSTSSIPRRCAFLMDSHESVSEGAKLSGQRSLTRTGGSRGANRRCDCQHHGGREPGSSGRVNPGKASLNVVIENKRKMLIRLDQKVSGQVGVLRTHPA